MENKLIKANLANFSLANKLLLAFLTKLNGEKIAVFEYKLIRFGLGLPRKLKTSTADKEVEKMP